MVGTERLLVDGNGTFEQRLGFGIAPLGAISLGKIVETRSDLGMVWTEYLFVDLADGSCTTDCAIANANGPSLIPNVAVKFNESIVRGAINYRFSL